MAARTGTTPPAAPGHRMELFEGLLGGVPTLAFAGRLHHYQGYSMAEVVQTVSHAHAWGATVLFLTNAAGSLGSDLAAGDIALVADHLNLMWDHPLRGTPAFVDMVGAYDQDLRNRAASAAALSGVHLAEVVYAGVPGPTFETPAEVRMLRLLGADIVGMSTVPEVIMARHYGMRVLALSVVTNVAGAHITGGDVLDAAQARAGVVGDLLEAVATSLA